MATKHRIDGPYASELESAGGFPLSGFVLWVYDPDNDRQPLAMKDPPRFVIPAVKWAELTLDQLYDFPSRPRFLDPTAPEMACLPSILLPNLAPWGTRYKGVWPMLVAVTDPMRPRAAMKWKIPDAASLKLCCLSIACHAQKVWELLSEKGIAHKFLPLFTPSQLETRFKLLDLVHDTKEAALICFTAAYRHYLRYLAWTWYARSLVAATHNELETELRKHASKDFRQLNRSTMLGTFDGIFSLQSLKSVTGCVFSQESPAHMVEHLLGTRMPCFDLRTYPGHKGLIPATYAIRTHSMFDWKPVKLSSMARVKGKEFWLEWQSGLGSIPKEWKKKFKQESSDEEGGISMRPIDRIHRSDDELSEIEDDRTYQKWAPGPGPASSSASAHPKATNPSEPSPRSQEAMPVPLNSPARQRAPGPADPRGRSPIRSVAHSGARSQPLERQADCYRLLSTTAIS